MKKLAFFAGIAGLLAFSSCRDKKEPIPPTPPPVENPEPPAAPQPQVNTTTVTTEEEEKDGTSFSIGKDGVQVENKDGDKESNVTISRKKSEIKFQTED